MPIHAPCTRDIAVKVAKSEYPEDGPPVVNLEDPLALNQEGPPATDNSESPPAAGISKGPPPADNSRGQSAEINPED